MGSHAAYEYDSAATPGVDVQYPPPPVPPEPQFQYTSVQPTQPQRGLSQTAIILCVIIGSVAVVCAALALGGDTKAAASIATMALLFGGILACVFHKRWL